MVLTGIEVITIVSKVANGLLFAANIIRKIYQFKKAKDAAPEKLLYIAGKFDDFNNRMTRWYKDTWHIDETTSHEVFLAYWGKESSDSILRQLQSIRDICDDFAIIMAKVAGQENLQNWMNTRQQRMSVPEPGDFSKPTAQSSNPGPKARRQERQDFAKDVEKQISLSSRVKFVLSRRVELDLHLSDLQGNFDLLERDAERWCLIKDAPGEALYNIVQDQALLRKVLDSHRVSEDIFGFSKILAVASTDRPEEDENQRKLILTLSPGPSDGGAWYHLALPSVNQQLTQEVRVRQVEKSLDVTHHSQDFINACKHIRNAEGGVCDFTTQDETGRKKMKPLQKMPKRVYEARRSNIAISSRQTQRTFVRERLERCCLEAKLLERPDRARLGFRIAQYGLLLLLSSWGVYFRSNTLVWLQPIIEEPSRPKQHICLEAGPLRESQWPQLDVEPQLFSIGVLLSEIFLSQPILSWVKNEDDGLEFEVKQQAGEIPNTRWLALSTLLIKLDNNGGVRIRNAVEFCIRQQADGLMSLKWPHVHEDEPASQKMVREEILREYFRIVYEPIRKLHATSCGGKVGRMGEVKWAYEDLFKVLETVTVNYV
jgi:hypothetical protein